MAMGDMRVPILQIGAGDSQKLYFFPVQHQTASICSSGCRIKPNQLSQCVCFLLPYAQLQFMTGMSFLGSAGDFQGSLSLSVPWLGCGFLSAP